MDKTWKVVLAFIGIFAAGAIAGGLVTLRMLNNFGPPRFGSPEQFGPQLMKRFTSKLELTAEQQGKIRPLITQAGEELHQMRRTTWTNSQAVVERVEGEINSLLTPEQKVKFEEIRAEQKERIKRFTEERARRLRESHRQPGEEPAAPAK